VPEWGGLGGGDEAAVGVNNQTTKHMNESGGEIRKGLAVMGRVVDIDHRIRHRLGEYADVERSYFFKNGDENLAKVLPRISREEWVFICASDLMGSVRSDHSFGHNAWQGYLLRVYLREVGMVKWADLFEKYHPLERRIDEIEGHRQDEKITDDEYDVLMEPIILQMQKMEEAADVYDFDEMDLLLLNYAVKHGFGDVAAARGEEEGDGRRE